MRELNKYPEQIRALPLNRRLVRTAGIGIFTILLLLLLQMPARAARQSSPEDLIRAAMVFNFCKFVKWPQQSPQNDLVLGVLTVNDRMADFSSIDGKCIKNRILEVRQLHNPADLENCDLVYMADQTGTDLATILQATAENNILTISEKEDFCRQGGIIQLVSRRGKMRFFINREAASQADLELSSQLLKMARIVEGD